MGSIAGRQNGKWLWSACTRVKKGKYLCLFSTVCTAAAQTGEQLETCSRIVFQNRALTCSSKMCACPRAAGLLVPTSLAGKGMGFHSVLVLLRVQQRLAGHPVPSVPDPPAPLGSHQCARAGCPERFHALRLQEQHHNCHGVHEITP